MIKPRSPLLPLPVRSLAPSALVTDFNPLLCFHAYFELNELQFAHKIEQDSDISLTHCLRQLFFFSNIFSLLLRIIKRWTVEHFQF